MRFLLKSKIGSWPRRIICLTSETAEIVFELGAEELVVGVSGYAVRPSAVRQKPKVAAFTSINLDKIKELEPDLILGFSDLQKDIARDLVAAGYPVFITNQRSLEEITETILAIGRLIGKETKAQTLAGNFENEIASLKPVSYSGKKPRVYFEEWDDPIISGIRWVSEIIEASGGEDIFRNLSSGSTASQRIINPEIVVQENPDIIFASWCGKKVAIQKILDRPGWDQIEAVKYKRVYEIKSADILAPGLSLLLGARKMAKEINSFR